MATMEKRLGREVYGSGTVQAYIDGRPHGTSSNPKTKADRAVEKRMKRAAKRGAREEALRLAARDSE
jgi:hypothetical protein